ncbi:S8 family peptidase [Halalkalicoccus ordinarius]|uniref:S8 family peptidase n=1 Tax=Halalkalicoccus ordinarius TaxID=3116651 RepID=UPI00300ED675
MTDIITRRWLLKLMGGGTVGVVAGRPAGAQPRGPLDRYIVGIEPGRADVARDAADEVYRVLDFGPVGQAVSGWFPEEALEGLRNNPNVRYVEAEGEVEAIGHATDEDGGDPSEEQVLPWGIDRVDADVAHHEDETGGGASVSIIDTGIDQEHETLDENVVGGRNFVDCPDGDADCADEWGDDNGHGTHCAGTANALDNGVGVVGTSVEADLYAVKVLDEDGSGTWSDVAAGIEWTADEEIDVGSLSLGGGDSSVVRDACEYAYGSGTLLVAAAGNDGPRPGSVGYPAAYEECIAVSATDENDDVASFSSRGEEVELAAPGVNVLSSLPGDGYDRYDGTSMACPHVSGAGAQLMGEDYTHEGARDRLNATAEDVGLDDTEQGNGLVDVAAAIGIENDGGEETSAPAIDRFELTDASNPRWARVEVDWAVSDDALETVESVLELDGDEVDSETSSVSGDGAEGEHELRERDGRGETYDVTLTVTDADGNSTSETDRIEL